LLGAPRTGSTILYQLLAKFLGLPYFSNLTNARYAATPIVGLAIQHAVAATCTIALESSFGKVAGAFQPSEASAVMGHWCGGGHPSQSVSASVLEDKREHMHRTLVAAQRMYRRPILIKNAWNCFRIGSLSMVFPRARFIWIRRDIRHAALSDLSARYVTKKSPLAWNSATPSTVDTLRTLPYWEQVVENQFEFNEAISASLQSLPAERATSLWYEDFRVSPASCLRKLAAFAGVSCPETGSAETAMKRGTAYQLAKGDASRVFEYVATRASRFGGMTHDAAETCQAGLFSL